MAGGMGAIGRESCGVRQGLPRCADDQHVLLLGCCQPNSCDSGLGLWSSIDSQSLGCLCLVGLLHVHLICWWCCFVQVMSGALATACSCISRVLDDFPCKCGRGAK